MSSFLRPARPPYRRRWLDRYWWTIPAGMCYAFALYAAYDGTGFTAAGFVVGGILISVVFGGVE